MIVGEHFAMREYLFFTLNQFCVHLTDVELQLRIVVRCVLDVPTG